MFSIRHIRWHAKVLKVTNRAGRSLSIEYKRSPCLHSVNVRPFVDRLWRPIMTSGSSGAPSLRLNSAPIDQQGAVALLQELITLRDRQMSSWVLESKAKTLVLHYKSLSIDEKRGFLNILASQHSVDHQRVLNALNQFKDMSVDSAVFLKAEEQLRTVLTPQYSWLFKLIGRLEGGVKILVDLRTDVLNAIEESDSSIKNPYSVPLQQLNVALRDLLSLWFSVGFLNLERVTWKSPCEMLQKISEYEAVHPVRNWTDLKRRVGAYRRCFVYTHSSMPSEPIVVLHTALCTEISSSLKGIIAATERMSDARSRSVESQEVEDFSNVSAAIFYSISSTQRGLQGIELGNYLIKRVARELQIEVPNLTQFSTLSPIPTFRHWLIDKMKIYGAGVIAVPEIWIPAVDIAGGWAKLITHILNNTWRKDPALVVALERPLLTTCAYYLFHEKRRGSAFDSVANFHLKNGAVMWRINWMADESPRGISNSCGLMVNYRYYLESTEKNSRNYLENKVINASDQVRKLAGDNLISKI